MVVPSYYSEIQPSPHQSREAPRGSTRLDHSAHVHAGRDAHTQFFKLPSSVRAPGKASSWIRIRRAPPTDPSILLRTISSVASGRRRGGQISQPCGVCVPLAGDRPDRDATHTCRNPCSLPTEAITPTERLLALAGGVATAHRRTALSCLPLPTADLLGGRFRFVADSGLDRQDANDEPSTFRVQVM